MEKIVVIIEMALIVATFVNVLTGTVVGLML